MLLLFFFVHLAVDAENIEVPEGQNGTLCACYIDVKHQSKLGYHDMKGCNMPDYVDRNTWNSTHCYSPTGICLREDKWTVSHENVARADVPFSQIDICEFKLGQRVYGCIIYEPESLNYQEMYVCNLAITKEREMTCCEGEMCNTDEALGLSEKEQEFAAECSVKMKIYILVGGVVAFLVAASLVVAIRTGWVKSLCQLALGRHDKSKSTSDEENTLCGKGDSYHGSSPNDSRGDGTNEFQSQNTTVTNLPSTSYFSSSVGNNLTDDMKDSGKGPAVLVQRTIARQITILDRVGSGRYGEVYQGDWQGAVVAVKKFHAWDDKSWQREYEIYGSLAHVNILGFIAADNKDNGQWTELWLVTEYHPHGSVFDYLQDRVVSPLEAVRMLSTAVNGLEYIHNEIVGTSGKPAIAHRDVKSKNILVKANGECCIGDLGLAIRSDWTCTTEPPLPSARLFEKNNLQVGTKRYMAPEVLNNTLDQNQFNNFKRADVYSMALVMWEVLNRTQITAEYECQPYRLPYYEYYPNDPSIDQMREIVVKYDYRPDTEFDDVIYDNEDLQQVKCLAEECWSNEPMARLPTLRLKKSLCGLYNRMTQNIF